jgi:RND family efflux transporter MFP subunit
MNTNNTHIRLFLLILTLSLLGGCGKRDEATAQTEKPSVRVRLSSVQKGTVEDATEYIAQLQSRQSVTLQPRIEGQISQIFVRSGDNVTQGQPLIQVDLAQQEASVSSFDAAAQAAQADLKNAEATLTSLQAQRLSRVSELKFNQLQSERYASLYAEGAVPKQSQDQYSSLYDVARSNLNALDKQIEAQRSAVTKAEKALQQAQANTKQQQEQLKYFTIAAPFTGRVGDIPVKVGDFVNTSTKLTTVTQNNPLEVNINVPTSQAPRLRKGMLVELMNAQGQIVGNSRVFAISPNATNNTQTVLIKALFDNKNNQLRSDEFARARVVWQRGAGLLVPTTAVSRVAGENFVYVLQKQEKSKLVVQQKPVKLGNIQGNYYQVTEGLQPGEQIATTNVANLSDGAAIVPES